MVEFGKSIVDSISVDSGFMNRMIDLVTDFQFISKISEKREWLKRV